jgi:hypothetical protein
VNAASTKKLRAGARVSNALRPIAFMDLLGDIPSVTVHGEGPR